MFYVGQKVVCVNDAPWQGVSVERGAWEGLLKKGGTYTVRWVGEFPYVPDRERGEQAIRLEGIVRDDFPIIPEFGDYPYSATRFRPVIERKTDISIFTAMLNPAKQSEKA